MRYFPPLLLAIGVASGPPAFGQEVVTEVQLENPVVALSDLAILPEHIALRHGSRPVVRFARNANTLTLSETRRQQLLRRQLPALNVRLRHADTVMFRSAARSKAPVFRRCYALQNPVKDGAFIRPADVVRVDCRADTPSASIRFSADVGALIATDRMDAGQYLGAVRIPPGKAVPTGANLTLVSRHGPVSVAREVTALQSSRLGKRI